MGTYNRLQGRRKEMEDEEIEYDDIEIGTGDVKDVTVEFPDTIKDLENDDEYEGECGYWLVIMLRGKTTGRRLKRIIFKAGLFQLICGFILLMITIYINDNFWYTGYYGTMRLGASLLSLMWLVSFPSVLAGLFSMLIIKYWPTLVTNRNIIINLMRMYMVIMVMLLISVCWCISSLIISFKGARLVSTYIIL